jgi:hypothetical protein
MITEIFNDQERQLLESYLINTKVDKTALDKLLEKLRIEKKLFDDVFLYLQVKKTLTP